MSAPHADWQAVRTGTVTAVRVDGLLFDVDMRTTTELLAALADGNTWRILPEGLPDDEQRAVWLEHLFGLHTDFDLADAYAVAETVVQHLTGVPMGTAVALARWATEDWLLLDGYHTGRGVDLLALTPRRLFAVLYAFLVEHRFEKRADADQALFPLTARPPTEAEAARDGRNFEAAMALAGSLPGVTVG